MLYSINFLRFIAALMVVVHHSSSAFSPPLLKSDVGAAGVDIFFIISGLVMGLTAGEGNNSWDFIKKRIIRIYPLYWIATVIYLGLIYYFWRDTSHVKDVLNNIFLFPNVNSDSWLPIYFPAWSLTFELGFYLLISLVLLFTKKPILPCIFLILIFSFIGPNLFGVNGQGTGIAFEFIFGLFLSVLIKNKIKIPFLVGIVFLCLAIYLFYLNPTPTGERYIAWGIPAFLITIFFISMENIKFFKNKYIIFLGSSSFSLYMIHITSQMFLTESFKRHGMDALESKFLGMGGLLLISLVSGFILYLCVEAPLLNMLRKIFLSTNNATK